MKPLSTLRAITASIAVVVLLAYITTFAAAPSVLPDFLRPVRGWRGLVPSVFSQAGADNPGTPRVQGVSNGFPVGVSGANGATLQTQGLGTAGAQSGGVLTVQGDGSGTAVPVQTAGSTILAANAADRSKTATVLSTACTTTTSCATTAAISWSVAGAQSAELVVTAISTPVGITTACDLSYDGGTTYQLAKCVLRKSDPTSTGTVKTALANGDLVANTSWTLLWDGAPSNVQVRLSLLTSGTVTMAGRAVMAPSAAPTIGAAIANGAPLNAAGSNIGQTMMAVDSATATTGRMLRASANGVLVDTGAVVTAASTAPVTGSASLTIVESPNSLGCAGQKVTTTNFKPVSITTGTQLITGTAAQNVYICSIDLVVGAADNVALVEGTGTVCATGIAGMAGGTTAATGWNFAANGGLTKGDGFHAQYKTATQADNVCLLVSGAAQVSGSLTWVSF